MRILTALAFIAAILLSAIPLIGIESEAQSSSSIPILKPLTSFKRLVIYYGWLNTSNLPNLNFDILVFSAATGEEKNAMIPVLKVLKKRGIEIYGYLHDGDSPIGLGSTFGSMVVAKDPSCSNDTLVKMWIDYVENVIKWMVANYTVDNVRLIDGVFLDEVDPSYFNRTNLEDQCVQKFIQGVREITSFAKRMGLKVFVNGVRYFAKLDTVDYYLWEDFLAWYNYTSNEYVYDDQFFQRQDNGNPLDLETGYGKYLWLKRNGVLRKTIVVTQANSSDLITYYKICALSYYLARILGVAGWSCGNWDYFAEGGSIPRPKVFEVGSPVSDPAIDVSKGIASRYFMLGEVVVDVPNQRYSTPLKDVDAYALDNIPETYMFRLSAVDGIYSRILDARIAFLNLYTLLQIFVNSTWSSPNVTAGAALWIAINSDGDNATGYPFTGGARDALHGADYLIEVYWNGEAILYRYNSSSEWFDIEVAYIDSISIATYNDSSLTMEIGIPMVVNGSTIINSSTMVSIVTVASGWEPDAHTAIVRVFDYNATPYPTIFDDFSLWYSNVNKIDRPVVVSIKKSGPNYVITVDAPSGYVANYTLYLDIPRVYKVVVKNGDLIKWSSRRVDGTTLLSVVIRHHSPATIYVYGESIGGNNPSLGGYGYTMIVPLAIALTIIVAIPVVAVKIFRRIKC